MTKCRVALACMPAMMVAFTSPACDSTQNAPGTAGSGQPAAATGGTSGGVGGQSPAPGGTGGSGDSATAGSAGTANAGTGGNAPTDDAGTSPPPADGGMAGAPALPALPSGLDAYWPTEDWRTATPDQVLIDQAGLQAAIDYAAESTTQGLLIVRYGYVVSEEYFGSFSAGATHESYSMAKSFTSALVGIAIERGLLPGVDARVCEFYPEDWDCADDTDPRSRIAVKHLLTLGSGLSWMEDWSGSGGGTNDAITMSGSPDPVAYVLNKEPASEPGTTFQYSTGDPALLSGILQQATGMTALEYAREHLLSPIGISELTWRSAASRTTTFAGIQTTVREYAKLGYLYLHRGHWDGTQVVPAAWVDVSTHPGQSLVDWYGYLWHVNMPSKFEDPSLPEDGFTAMGVFGQYIMVIPSQHLVVVRVAMDALGTTDWNAATFLGHLLGATQ